MKVTNTTKGDLVLATGEIVPAMGSLDDLSADSHKTALAVPVSAAWIKSGMLVVETELESAAEKAAAEKAAAEKAAAEKAAAATPAKAG